MQLKADFIWFNGIMVPWKEAKIHVMSHSLHYGTSIFEGIRCYNSYKGSVIFRNCDHMQRLVNSAKIYRMPITIDIHELTIIAKQVIKKNNLIDAYIRPLVFIGDIGISVNPPCNYKTDIIIAAFPLEPYLGKESLKTGIDTIISSWNKVSANTIPTLAKAGGNYLSSILIANEAHRHNCHEGIALNTQGYVSEGSGENIFEIKNNILFTPPLTSSILPGITRDTVIHLANHIGLTVKEEHLVRESLYLADELFITGTAAEIVPIRSVDGIKIGNGNCGPITQEIQKTFFGLFTGITKDKWNWLDPVYNT